MMGPLLVTIVLLATHITCTLTAPCDLSSPLDSTKASELLRNYTEQIQNNAGGNIRATVLQLVEFALNTTGDNALKSKLNWEDTCFDLFKFTLSQVALINGKELDKFPGDASMDDVRALLTSDATKAVVQDVNKTLNTLRDRNVSLDRNLDVFIQDVRFIIKKSSFISIMSYALNSSDHNSTVALLGYDQRLVNATLVDIAEHLFLTPKELQMNLTLEYVVRYLRSAHTFLQKLQDYLKKQRETRWAEKTVKDLVNTEDNILTALKRTYQGNNLTFIQFFWEQKVELSYFDYTVAELAISTSIQSAVIKNYTIEQLFEFLYNYAELNIVYRKSVEASKRMRERILEHYNIASVSILLETFNVTLSQLARLTDIEFENYAIKYYIHRYTKVHLNTTFNELETFAKLEPGSLENATVQDFAQLMAKIGVAYEVKALNESGSLNHLLNNHSALEIHMKPLRLQIEKDRQPLTLNNSVLFREFQLHYLIYLRSLDSVVFYERSVFNFTETFKLNWHSLFELDVPDRQVLKGLFIRYSFKDLSIFFGIKKYTIFSWKFPAIITRLLILNRTESDECTSGNHSCAKESRCENYVIGGYTCICPAGLNVDPDNYCRDMNECKLVEPKNGGCSKDSHCVNTYGSSICVCDEAGYKKNQAGECVDINECATIFNKCFPLVICDNLPGSYRCICDPGFEFFDGSNYCKDIDECKKDNGGCEHNCTNTDGSRTCSCKRGYQLDNNKINCTDINECEKDNGGCEYNCTNTDGSRTCSCKRGYQLDNNKMNCTDINECEKDNGGCEHNCTNTNGSRTCSCKRGYKLDNNKMNCTDINECAIIFNKCFPLVKCDNLPGSYRCICDPGFEFNYSFNYCKDINECEKDNGGCEHNCTNTDGSRTCSCKRGYQLDNNKMNCTDINECEKDNGGCEYNCTNTDGSRTCSCKRGYQLDNNKMNCTDINECEKDNGGCEHNCTNTDGSRTCSCKRGYQLDNNKMNCTDIDECKVGPGCPAKGQKCKNKKGGYKCRCPPRTFSDGKFACKKSKRFRLKIRFVRLVWKIELRDEFSEYYNATASLVVLNVDNFFNRKSRFEKLYYGCTITGFEYSPGSIVANVLVNFDPKASNVTINSLNQDINGTNAVMGDLSFDPQKSYVYDLNECNDPEANDCHSDATCTNTEGSFSCSCKDGYEGDGVNCAKNKKPGSNNTALIISIFVAVSLLIITLILLLIIVLCCYKR